VKLQRIQHQFVEFVPEKLEPGKLYVSLEYNTANHLCACGCGYEVVTILGPADSSITYNGRGVSISPSIGNSNFPCKSHYWIQDNSVLWEARMTQQLTALSRVRDKAAKAREYGKPGHGGVTRPPEGVVLAPPAAASKMPAVATEKPKSWWRRLMGD
jgi:hypothetical protein